MQESPKTRLMIEQFHTHDISPSQCTSSLVQTIEAPLPVVWSVVREFTKPQTYKKFIKSCTMRQGHGDVGSIREVMVVSGLPAGTSMERLDCLNDDMHVMSFSIIGGDHRLKNYRSTTTLHEEERKTVVIESYVVDVPEGSSKEDTCSFADTIVGTNLRSLAKIAEKMVSHYPAS